MVVAQWKQKIKGYTSKILRDEFTELSKMPSLWTRNYFVSTDGNVYSETIKKICRKPKEKILKREHYIRKRGEYYGKFYC